MALQRIVLILAFSAAAEAAAPAWTTAHAQGPLSAAETRAFMTQLAEFVFDHHLKKAPTSPQRGMVYEYRDVARKEWVQGEGLDTMHDGAWFAAALVNAYRATSDGYYKDFLTDWMLPFYLKMLNHSDELFTARGAVVRKGGAPWGKAWAFQEGEKGFIPYWWDDGASISLERRRDGNPLPNRPSIDHTVGKPNPKALLDGYSLGMSNHMAQDIGVLVQMCWLLLKDSDDPKDRKLAAETAEAAKNLHECRMRHFGFIPMCVAPTALASGDAKLMRRAPSPDGPAVWLPDKHYWRALYDLQPGRRQGFPGFADDSQYRFYHGLARTGGTLTPALAFQTVVQAYTLPALYRVYSDDAPVPPGINKFDLYPHYAANGKPVHYRSDRKGPSGGPLPIGSRLGPQNMVCCGWALQALKAQPGLWEQGVKRVAPEDPRVTFGLVLPRGADDGVPYSATLDVAGARLRLASSVDRFYVKAAFKQGAATLRIFGQPDAKGSHAVVSVKKGQPVTAVNDAGGTLIVERADQRGADLAFGIPYTFVKGQKPWMNGVELGRYSIRVGDEIVKGEHTRNFVMASSEAAVKAWIEWELGCGLRTWKAIFDEKGFIPTGMGTKAHWDGFSDSGGYAHLLSAGAQWLLYLDGKKDWKVHNYPKVIEEK